MKSLVSSSFWSLRLGRKSESNPCYNTDNGPNGLKICYTFHIFKLSPSLHSTAIIHSYFSNMFKSLFLFLLRVNPCLSMTNKLNYTRNSNIQKRWQQTLLLHTYKGQKLGHTQKIPWAADFCPLILNVISFKSCLQAGWMRKTKSKLPCIVQTTLHLDMWVTHGSMILWLPAYVLHFYYTWQSKQNVSSC